MRGQAASADRTLVLGLGNDILADDGVGLQAARRVGEVIGDLADVAEASIATIDLLSMMSGYDRVVIVDAFLSRDLPVGTQVRATPEDLPKGFGYRSFHTLTFGEVMELGEWLGVSMPSEVVIHGLSVDQTDTFGEALSPEVEQAWEGWADDIVRIEFGVDRAGTRSHRPDRPDDK